MTRDDLTAGLVTVTVTLPETFVRARQLCGDTFRPAYTFRVERVDSGALFLSCRTETAKGERWVYAGVVHPTTGSVRLTTKSAFPAHATRVRVADRVLRMLFTGNAERIAAAGWRVECEVLEAAGRF